MTTEPVMMDESSSSNINEAPENPKRTRPTRKGSSTTRTSPCSASPAAIAAANSNHHKLVGRRGDIRMHKAVAARLADPSITLYGALIIGGFDFPSEESANALDGEKVTLGQRKNQLSRRLRLAKKQQQQQQTKTPGGAKGCCKHDDLQRNDDACGGANDEKSSSISPPQTDATSRGHPAHPNALGHPSTPTLLIEQKEEEEEEQATTGAGAQHRRRRHHRHPRDDATNTKAAIASLLDSAQAIGLSIDQLAETIATNRRGVCNLVMEKDHSQCCTTKDNPEATTFCPTRQKQEKVALKLHQIESKSLYDKCLVLADAELADDENYAPNSQHHLAFCFQAWQNEGKRLCGLREKHHPQWKEYHFEQWLCCHEEGPSNAGTKRIRSNTNTTNTNTNTNTNGTNTNTNGTNSCEDSHSRNHHKKKKPSPHNQHHHHNKKKKKGACHNQTGLHIHRLDGQCGHKAILHHPKDGVPHIDFIVGDVVECYHGMDPIQRRRRRPPPPPSSSSNNNKTNKATPQAASEAAAAAAAVPPSTDRVGIKWQSKYTCGEMDCSGDCSGSACDDGNCDNDHHYDRDHDHDHHHQVHNSPSGPPHAAATAAAAAAATVGGSTTTIMTENDPSIAHPSIAAPPLPTTKAAGVVVAAAAAAADQPKTIPIAKIKENDPEWNFDLDDSMDDLLSGLLLHNEMAY